MAFLKNLLSHLLRQIILRDYACSRKCLRSRCVRLLTALLNSWKLWNRVAGSEKAGFHWRHAYLNITLPDTKYGYLCDPYSGERLGLLSVDSVHQEHGTISVEDASWFDRLPIA